ncbi:MAG TPA: LacI family DNA-binding transcriptional regulator [Streptosporangiaceae bacterium]|nr:LacI family DNA-binding transcriptional regulator [Streptosporangiaceae bacterium]
MASADRGGSVVTLYDVARLAGVSTATVSRVVHGQDRVRETTRAKVQRVIEQLGYVPDSAAQSLSRRRKDVIGLVTVEREAKQYDVENMGLLYYDEILRGVQARIRDDHRWSLLIATLYEEEERDYPRLLSLTGKVDGLLIGEGIIPDALLARLTERVPVVIIAGSPGKTDVVKADNYSGATALFTHLVEEHGCRRFFHADGPAYVPDALERRIALEQVIQSHPHCELIGSYRGILSVRSGEDAANDLLIRHGQALPDAVVCVNDQMAMGVLAAFAKAGVRVPEDVAVTGFDDIYPGSLNDSPLSTVHQPMRLLGERACDRLLDRIARPNLRRRVELLPTELVLRSSCGCPPGVMTRRPVQAIKPPASRGRAPGNPDGRRGRLAKS